MAALGPAILDSMPASELISLWRSGRYPSASLSTNGDKCAGAAYINSKKMLLGVASVCGGNLAAKRDAITYNTGLEWLGWQQEQVVDAVDDVLWLDILLAFVLV